MGEECHSAHSVNAHLNSLDLNVTTDKSTSDLLWKLVPAAAGIIAKISA